MKHTRTEKDTHTHTHDKSDLLSFLNIWLFNEGNNLLYISLYFSLISPLLPLLLTIPAVFGTFCNLKIVATVAIITPRV